MTESGPTKKADVDPKAEGIRTEILANLKDLEQKVASIDQSYDPSVLTLSDRAALQLLRKSIEDGSYVSSEDNDKGTITWSNALATKLDEYLEKTEQFSPLSDDDEAIVQNKIAKLNASNIRYVSTSALTQIAVDTSGASNDWQRRFVLKRLGKGKGQRLVSPGIGSIAQQELSRRIRLVDKEEVGSFEVEALGPGVQQLQFGGGTIKIGEHGGKFVVEDPKGKHKEFSNREDALQSAWIQLVSNKENKKAAKEEALNPDDDKKEDDHHTETRVLPPAAPHTEVGGHGHDTGGRGGGHEGAPAMPDELHSREDFNRALITNAFADTGVKFGSEKGAFEKAKRWLGEMPWWKRWGIYGLMGIAAGLAGAGAAFFAAKWVAPLVISKLGLAGGWATAGFWGTKIGLGLAAGLGTHKLANMAANAKYGIGNMTFAERAKVTAGYEKANKRFGKLEKIHLRNEVNQKRLALALGGRHDPQLLRVSTSDVMASYEKGKKHEGWWSMAIKALAGFGTGFGIATTYHGWEKTNPMNLLSAWSPRGGAAVPYVDPGAGRVRPTGGVTEIPRSPRGDRLGARCLYEVYSGPRTVINNYHYPAAAEAVIGSGSRPRVDLSGLVPADWSMRRPRISAALEGIQVNRSEGTVRAIRTALENYGINRNNNSRLVSLLDGYLDSRGTGGRRFLSGENSPRNLLLQMTGGETGNAGRISGRLDMQHLFGNPAVRDDLLARLREQVSPAEYRGLMGSPDRPGPLQRLLADAALLRQRG